MYWNDHNPPHFHAYYGGCEAAIVIDGFELMSGELPPRVLGLVIEWAELHHDELMDNWNSIRVTGNFRRIEPLT